MRELIEAKVEIARECQVRQSVYPKLVASGRLSQGEADRRMRAIRHVLYLLDAAAEDKLSTNPNTGE